jgi:hypothetical protein
VTVIDHLVYGVADLGAAVADLERAVGVRPALGGAHTGMGTHNALLSLGSCYLELIAPDPGQPDPDGPRPFGLDELSSPRLVTFAARPSPHETLGSVIGEARTKGYDPGTAVAMSRTTPHGETLHWHLTFPRPDTDGLVPFLIDWGATPQPSDTAPGGVEIVELVAEHPHPARIERARSALGLHEPPVREGERPRLTAVVRGPAGEATL